MNFFNNPTLLIGAGVLALVVFALAVWFFSRRKQSRGLKQRFGPEYGRAMDELGSRTKAEAELKARQRRVERLDIVPLTIAEAARFSESWKALQVRFVDDPQGSVVLADQLVRELMHERGYPVGDFERRAADISVDHPIVVENYRAAEHTATRNQRGAADTEELRNAIVHYRALFDDLLDVREDKPGVLLPRRVAVPA